MKTEPPSGATRLFFAILVAAAITFIGMGLQGLAWSAPWFRSRSLHITLAATALALALRGPLDRMARAQLGARGPVALWSAMAIAALAQTGVLSLELDGTIAYRFGFLTSTRRLWELEPDAALIPIAALIAARFTSGPVRIESARRRWLALGAACVATALLGLGLARAARTAPIQRFVSGLPVIARPPQGGSGALIRGGETRESIRYDDTALPSLVLRRYIFAERSVCVWRAAPTRDALPARETIEYDRMLSCNDVTVREHRASGTIILSSAWSSYGADGDEHLAFRASDGAVVRDASAPAIRGAVSVPASWIGPSALLLAGAWALLWLGRRATRELAACRGWMQGTLRADGMIALPDGAVVAAPYGMDLPAGPVVITEPIERHEAAFRDGAVRMPLRAALLPGSIGEVELSANLWSDEVVKSTVRDAWARDEGPVRSAIEALEPRWCAQWRTAAAKALADDVARQQREQARAHGETRPYRPAERYAVGEYIEHKSFGVGRVRALLSANKIEVQFDDKARALVHSLG